MKITKNKAVNTKVTVDNRQEAKAKSESKRRNRKRPIEGPRMMATIREKVSSRKASCRKSFGRFSWMKYFPSFSK